MAKSFNERIGTMYVGIGTKYEDRGGRKGIKAEQARIKKDFQRLSSDLERIPFFGGFIRSMKDFKESVGALVGAVGATASARGRKGAAKSTGNLLRGAAVGAETASAVIAKKEATREAGADAADRKLQLQQNMLIAEDKRVEQLRRVVEGNQKSLKNNQRILNELIEEGNKIAEAAERAFEEEIKALSAGLHDIADEASEQLAELEGQRKDNATEQKKLRAFLKGQIKATEDAQKEFESVSEAKAKQDIRNAKIAQDQLNEFEKVGQQTERQTGFLEKTLNATKSLPERMGKDIAKGLDQATGNRNMSNMDGKGSVTGSLLKGLGLGVIFKKFPALAGYASKFAASIIASKAAAVALGASLVAIPVVLAGMTIAMVKFVKGGREAAEQFDVMVKQAELMKISVNELNKLRQQGIAFAGMEARQVDVAIQRFARRLADGTLDKPLQDMGFTLKEIEGLKLETTDKALGRVRQKMAGIADQNRKLALGFKMFDAEGAKFALALGKQADEVANLNRKMAQYGVLVSATQKQALKDAKATNEELELMAEGRATQAGAAMAGVANSWNKLVKEVDQSLKLSEMFNWAITKTAKFVEATIDTIRVAWSVAIIPIRIFVEQVSTIFKIAEANTARLATLFYNLLIKPIGDFLRYIPWVGDQIADMLDSYTELLGAETAMNDTLDKQFELRQKLADARAKELADIEAATKAKERELAVLMKGEDAVKRDEISAEYEDQLAQGPFEGETADAWMKRQAQTYDDMNKALEEYDKAVAKRNEAQKKIDREKLRREREKQAIEEKYEKKMQRLRDRAAHQTEKINREADTILNSANNAFGSQSFSAGSVNFTKDSREEFDFYRNMEMQQKRLNRTKDVDKIRNEKLEDIANFLEQMLELETNAMNMEQAAVDNPNSVSLEGPQPFFQGVM